MTDQDASFDDLIKWVVCLVLVLKDSLSASMPNGKSRKIVRHDSLAVLLEKLDVDR